MLRIGEAFGDVTPWAPASQPAPDIFIIGLPRSGTTLLERLMLGLPASPPTAKPTISRARC